MPGGSARDLPPLRPPTRPARLPFTGHRRAHLAASEQADAFPPDRVGTFANEAEELRFYAAFAEAPCPALDPDSGACLLYAWRPVVCRTHGPPLRERDGDVAHCPLCFTTATPAQIEAARTTGDVDDIERPLVERVEQETDRRGMTSVTFALAEPAPAR
jgi:Fe-S-cluster containining protein